MPIKSVNVFRVFVLILLLVSFKSTFAQFGNIKLDVNRADESDSNPYELRVYQMDSILIYKQNIFYADVIHIDSVQSGVYDVLIFKLGKKHLTLHSIIVKPDSVTFLSLDLFTIGGNIYNKINADEKAPNNHETSSAPNFAFTIQTYQPGFTSDKEIVNSVYDLGIKFTPLYNPSKYYGVGANFGSNFGFCDLQKDKILAFADTFNVERYFYWKIFAGFNNRMVFVQPKENKSMRPCFLDFGIGYNFPFIYRYVGLNRDSKKIRGFISDLNDFSVTTRLGFGFLSFTASYRITNDLKKAYQDIPRLMVGLDFIIPND